MGVFTKDPNDDGREKPKPYNTLRAITASAAVVKATDKSEIEALKQRKATQKWQPEAWEYFDLIAEIAYAFMLFANVLSRIRLHSAWIDEEGDTPTPIRLSDAPEEVKQHASDAMKAIFGSGKQAAILHKTALNLLVAGECYLVRDISYDTGTARETWRIVSIDELVPVGKGMGLKLRGDAKEGQIKPLPADTFMGRIWRPHPRFSDEPYSSMKALCDTCNELLLLSRSVRATARSRLNAGALLIPDEIGQTRDATTDEVDDDIDAYVEEERDELEEELMNHMLTPVGDEGSAAAVVPIIFRGPAEGLKEVRLLKFERSFDAALAVQRDRDLDRILQGIELPKEIVSGLANIKYSNAIQINESLYTSHVEPMVVLLCDVFRTMYLEPYLRKQGVDEEDIAKVVVWYDPSGITTAPDKSTAANVGFEKMAINSKAWRRENGFSEEDAPSDREKVFRMVMQRGMITPEFMDVVLQEMVPELLQRTREQTIANSGAPIPPSVDDLIGNEQAPPADPGAPASPGGETGAEPPPGLAEPGEGAPDSPAAPESGDFTEGFTTDDES